MNASSQRSNTDPIPFIDTHHHLWDLHRYRYDWLLPEGRDDVTAVLGDYASIRQDYLIDELLAEYRSAGVVKSIHVQADISEPDPVVETSWLQAVSAAHGFPHAIVAFSDLRAPRVLAELDRHLAHPGIRGIRMPDEAGLLSDPAFRRGVSAMARRGLSLQVDAPLPRMAELRDLAETFPGMRFFLGHTGFPEQRTDAYLEAWRRGMDEAARASNVVVKISGLGMGEHEWTIDSIRPWVLGAIEAFGVERSVFGTNWPVDRLYGDLPTLVDSYRDLVSDFTRDEQDALLWRNAERYYEI